MTVEGIHPYLERKGGMKQWEAPAKKAEEADRTKQYKKDPNQDVRPDQDSRQQWMSKWIETNRKPEKEWIVTVETEEARANWVKNQVLSTAKKGKPFKLGIDTGSLYTAISKHQKNLSQQVKSKSNSVTLPDAVNTFEAERTRSLVALVQSRTQFYGPNPIVGVAFDHHDQRDTAKRRVELSRLRKRIDNDSAREFPRENIRRYSLNARMRNFKAYVRPSKAHLKPIPEEPEEAEGGDAMRGVESEVRAGEGGQGGTGSEDRAESRAGEGSGGAGGTGRGSGGGGGGRKEVGIDDGESFLSHSTVIAHNRSRLPSAPADQDPFSLPWKLFDQEYVDQCPTEALKAQAQTLRSSNHLIYATSEADYLLSDFLAGTLKSDSPRLAAYLPPSTSNSSASPSLPPLPPHRETINLAVSDDGDLIPASDRDVVDFILSTLYINGVLHYRAINVQRMWKAMRWKDQWELAALCAFASTDFTDGGISGIGFTSIENNTPRCKTLRQITVDAKDWFKAYRHLRTYPTSNSPVKVGSEYFKSFEELESAYNDRINPFYKNKPKLERLSLDQFIESVRIQVDRTTAGSTIRKSKLLREVQSQHRSEMQKRLERTLGHRPSKAEKPMNLDLPPLVDSSPSPETSSPPLNNSSSSTDRPPQPRNHLVSFTPDSRPPDSLPFDEVPELSATRSYRRTRCPNGPVLLERWQEEHLKIREHLGIESDSPHLPANNDDDNDEGGSDRSGSVNADDAQEESSSKEEEAETASSVPESKRRRLDKGKGKAKESDSDLGEGRIAEEDQNDDAKDEGGNERKKESTEAAKEKSKWAKRFPAHGKQATQPLPQSQHVHRAIELDGVINFPKHASQLAGWIRQAVCAEMPIKVEILISIFSGYSRFYPHRLVELVPGGTKFTQWAVPVIHRRETYELCRQRARTNRNDQPFLVPADPEEYGDLVRRLQAKLELDRSALTRLDSFVRSHTLQKFDVEWIVKDLDDPNSSKEVDILCHLAIIRHHQAALPCPTIIESSLDARNLVNFATSIHNSTRSDGLALDFIIVKRLINSPLSFIEHHESTTRFETSKTAMRAAHSALDPDSLYVLGLLSHSLPIQRLLRKTLSTSHLGPLTSNLDPLINEIQTLSSKLLPLLSSLATNSTTPAGRSPLTYQTAINSASAVLTYLIEVYRWIIVDLRRWVNLFKLDEVQTLGDWIVKSGGSERTEFQDGRRKRSEKKKAKKWQAKMNGDETEKISNKFLRPLQALVACWSSIRDRSYRFSPQTAHVNPQILFNVTQDSFGLPNKLMRFMLSNNTAARLENSKPDFRSVTPFVLPTSRTNPPSEKFDPDRIAGETLLRHRSEDTILKRQLHQPHKVFMRNQDEWKGLPLCIDLSPGPFVERNNIKQDLQTFQSTVAAFQVFFSTFGIKNQQDANHVSIFLMELMFKPHWGQRLPNGDFGISPTNYLIGVNDPRYLSRAALGKLDPAARQAPYQELVLELMNAKLDLKRVFKKMEAGLRPLQQVRHLTTDRTDVEIATIGSNRQDRLREVTEQRPAKTNEEEELRLRLAAWEADPRRDSLEKPKKFRPPRYHSTDPTRQQSQRTEPVVLRFALHNDNFVYTSPTHQASPLAPQPHERRPPHLYMAGVPEGATELDRPARAERIVTTFFDNLEQPDASTESPPPSWMLLDDDGEHVAQAKTCLNLTGDGSVRHLHHQKPNAVRQAQNGRVAKVLATLEPTRRLYDAQDRYTRSLPHSSVSPLVPPPSNSSKNLMVQQRLNPPPLAPTPTLAPLRVNPQPFPSQLIRLAPRIQYASDVKQGQWGQLRSNDVQEYNTRIYQAQASQEVRDLFPNPNPRSKQAEKRKKKKESSKKGRKRRHEMDQKKKKENRDNSKSGNAPPADPSPLLSEPSIPVPSGSRLETQAPIVATDHVKSQTAQSDSEMADRPPSPTIAYARPSVMYFPSSGSYPQGARKGQNVNSQRSRAFESGLKTTPWIDPSVCTVGEGYTSSVCPDPKCRASVLSPRRHAAPKFASKINRVKDCLPSKLMDHRDGLAGPNIGAIVYNVSHGVHRNPLSLDLAQSMGNGNRYTPHQVNAVEKELAVTLAATDTLQEQREVMERAHKSTTQPAPNIKSLRAALRAGPTVEDGDDLESEEEEIIAVKQKRGRGKRGKRVGTKSYDYEDPVNDD